jgi:uridine kinase
MSHKPYLVGIVGGSGSGKTSFLRELLNRLPAKACAVISQDNYYRPLHEQERDANGQPNFDLPTSIYLERFRQDLRALLRGEAIEKNEYTYNHREREGQRIVVEPAAVLIVEGLFLFHDDEIRGLFDLRVFIEAPVEICKMRRLERDAKERNYPAEDVEYRWTHHVLPAYERFILPYRNDAHIIIANHASYDDGLEAVTQHLQNVIVRP